MEGVMYTKQKDFYTDEMMVVNIATVKLWNVRLKETFNKKDASKFTRKEMIEIMNYLKCHTEIFYNQTVHNNFIYNMEQLIMLMHGNEKCIITFHS